MDRVSHDVREERRDRHLTWSAAVLAVVVVVVQVALRSENIRRLLNESIRMEGLPLTVQVQGLDDPARPWLDWPPAGESGETGMLCLRVLRQSRGEAWVVLSGRPVQVLPPEGAVVTVRDGDRVEVSSPAGEVSVLVSSVSGNIEAPLPGDWVAGSGRFEVCVVELR